MSDERQWTNMGGDLEASYDGTRYVDFRAKGTGKCVMFATREVLIDAMRLFPPMLSCKKPNCRTHGLGARARASGDHK